MTEPLGIGGSLRSVILALVCRIRCRKSRSLIGAVVGGDVSCSDEADASGGVSCVCCSLIGSGVGGGVGGVVASSDPGGAFCR